MGFLRRLVEEGSKQLNDVAKQVNEAMKELERQANEAKSQQQHGSSSSTYPTSMPNYHGDEHESPTERYLRMLHLQQIDDRIRFADESMTRTGVIGSNNQDVEYVINNSNNNVQTPSYANSSSTIPADHISREQHLRNMRSQQLDARIRAADESITRTGVIGTNSRLVYYDDPLGNIR